MRSAHPALIALSEYATSTLALPFETQRFPRCAEVFWIKPTRTLKAFVTHGLSTFGAIPQVDVFIGRARINHNAHFSV